MHAKWDSMRGAFADVRYWKTHWVRRPDERVHFSNSPMAFPCGSQVLDSSLSELRTLLSREQGNFGKLDYTAIVKIVLNNIRASGLALDVVGPMIFHPIPHFASACHMWGKASASSALASSVRGVQMPSTETVLAESSAVSQTWFSWSKEHGLHDRLVIRDSLYSQLLTKLKLPSLDGKSLCEMTPQFFGSPYTSTPSALGFRPSEVRNPPQPKRSRLTDKTPSALGFRPSEVRNPSQPKRSRLTDKTPEDSARASTKLGVCTMVSTKLSVLQNVFGKIFPGALSWEEYMPAIAICRSAAPVAHLDRARVIFRIERLLRLRGKFVRRQVQLPAALSIWAGALALWRGLSSSSGFDPVDPVFAKNNEGMLVDCMLSMASARSSLFPCDSHLRVQLRTEHDATRFDFTCATLVNALPHMDESPALR